MVANINKKGHAYKVCGLREGDVLLRINEHDLSAMNLNDVKAKLVAKCGTVLHLELRRPGAAAAGAGSFAEWLASARGGGQEAAFAGPYSADVILEFGPLVKSIKSGKPAQRGASAELSLKMADSQVKRELFFVAGALQPLCKLLTDPKAAAQVLAVLQTLCLLLYVSLCLYPCRCHLTCREYTQMDTGTLRKNGTSLKTLNHKPQTLTSKPRV